MKFISVNSVKNLTPGKQVYTLNDKGEYGVGILISRTEDASGVHLRFEVPQYFNPIKPAIHPVEAVNITHVCLQRDRNAVTSENGVREVALNEV